MGKINRGKKNPVAAWQGHSGAKQSGWSPECPGKAILATGPRKGSLEWPTYFPATVNSKSSTCSPKATPSAAIERLTGTQKRTVLRLLVRFGKACRELLDRKMRGLTLDHLEVDEMWTFCRKKQARLTMEERATRHDIGDIYLWICLDQRNEAGPHVRGRQAVGRHGPAADDRPVEPAWCGPLPHAER